MPSNSQTQPIDSQVSAMDSPLTVAISSTALFDLSVSNEIYKQQGLEAYRQYQISEEDTPLEPGDGYYLVEKLSNINKISDKPLVEILLLSRHCRHRVQCLIRFVLTIWIPRAAFCGGESPYRYIKAFRCDLFLHQRRRCASSPRAKYCRGNTA